MSPDIRAQASSRLDFLLIQREGEVLAQGYTDIHVDELSDSFAAREKNEKGVRIFVERDRWLKGVSFLLELMPKHPLSQRCCICIQVFLCDSKEVKMGFDAPKTIDDLSRQLHTHTPPSLYVFNEKMARLHLEPFEQSEHQFFGNQGFLEMYSAVPSDEPGTWDRYYLMALKSSCLNILR